MKRELTLVTNQNNKTLRDLSFNALPENELSILKEKNTNLIKILEEMQHRHEVDRGLAIELKEVINDLEFDLNEEKSLRHTREIDLALILSQEQKRYSDVDWKILQDSPPTASGIYLLSDGIRQCVGYYNQRQACFAPSSYLNQPTHWMTMPPLPDVISV